MTEDAPSTFTCPPLHPRLVFGLTVSKRIITVNRRGVRRVFQRTAKTVAKIEMEVSLLLLIDAGASVPGRVKQCVLMIV